MIFGKVPQWLSVLLLCALTAQPGYAADIQKYDFKITGPGLDGMRDTLIASAQLAALNGKSQIPPFALIERAREDVPRLQTALDSFGYYHNKVVITIAGQALDNPGLAATLDALPAGRSIAVAAQITPGPLYHIGHITLKGAPPKDAMAALGIAPGDPAVARTILDARTILIVHLQEQGYALAQVEGPDATADDTAHTIDLTYTVTPGQRIKIGEIRFQGLNDVNESFARQALTVHSGDLYRPSRIEAARQALMAQGVFSGINVRATQHPTSDGRMPLIFDVQERKQHAITLSGTYSTDLGINLSATWSHRNLFGNGEQLNLTAGGSGLGDASAGLGYNLVAQYVQPWFLRQQNQTLDVSLSGVKQKFDAYDQTAQTIAAHVRRKFSDLWTGSAGLSLAHDDVTQNASHFLYKLIALPIGVNYDSTGSIGVLTDPVRGLRAALTVAPTLSLGHIDTAFLLAQASGSSYFDLTDNGRSVLALRALVGTIMGASNLSVPPDQRFYAGGSATVRGYTYQSIGPQFSNGKPMGGKSVDAATVEWRQRIGEDWGATLFADAGQVSSGSAPFSGAVRVGVGVGARYYTPLGAVRFDVAMPLRRLPGSNSFEIYIGLGQAF
jgi:translocation and assembly module TamA